MLRLVALVTSCAASLALAAEPPKSLDALTFGISQPYGADAAAQVAPLVEPYLTKALKGPVKVVRFETNEALSDALAAGKVDVAWITPLAFVRAQQKNAGVAALSKAMRGGSLFYRAVFITKGDAPKLDALKGKKVAYVSKDSTSGYLFAREMLRSAGLPPDGFFASETFAGDHLSVCKAVREGKADVGATFASEPAEGKEVEASGCVDAPPVSDFKVVASTGNLPNEVIAVRDFFPPTRVNDLIAAFGRMDSTPEGKKVLEVFRADSWGVAVDGDFAQVQALLKPKAAKPDDAAPAKPAKKKSKK